MGLSASCVFVRNPQQHSAETLPDMLRQYMTGAGFTETDASGADTVLRMYVSGTGQWFALSPDTENTAALSRCASIAAAAFKAPVITAELVDSDFVLLTLHSETGKKCGSISVGEPYGGRMQADYQCFAELFPEKLTAAQIQEICEGNCVFAEEGFAALSACLELDDSLLTEPESAESVVQYYKKVQQPEAERTELYAGNILSLPEKPDVSALAEHLEHVMEAAWERTEQDTGRYIRIMETENSLLLFSNLLYPKQLAACAGETLLHISVSAQDIETAVLQPNIMSKALYGTLPLSALPELLETAGTTESAFREAALNGIGCTTLFFTGRTRPAGRIGLTVRDIYDSEKFAYLFQNPVRLSTTQVMEKLDVFLSKAYGPKTIAFQRLNPDTGDYEPVSYQDPGGICRTDKAHGEAYLRIYADENGIALTGSLGLPDSGDYVSALEQESLLLELDFDNKFAELHHFAPDGSRLGSDMTDIDKYSASCSKFGFDGALLDAVYSDKAVVCWYSRPRD